VIVFQSRTGWISVLVSTIGILTAVDVMPLVSEALVATVGPAKAHTAGVVIALVGVVVAKLSDPKKTAP
jgi:multisubunit Na+/H+ antiporter MnhG subunit